MRLKSLRVHSVTPRGRKRLRILAGGFFFLNLNMPIAEAKDIPILQTLEPGMGFVQFKQWAIEKQLVFENFTKDSLLVRDTGINTWESIRIQVRFCGGDDYAGRASAITIQQLFKPEIDVVVLQRDYVEFLSGKSSADGKLPGTFSVRRDRNDGSGDGLSIIQESEKGSWEVGLFKKTGTNAGVALLQTIRRRESVCQ
jgi:hypothetical protein